ncbi:MULTISPECIES: glycosyltransferase family 4 protein [Butyricimonas]|uniref:glycosyltransferase family 4 protein n=1 Tax=Butyricimonas TaxID=574697 RepID=UPI0007FB5B84|nr:MULTISPECIES: glycosyltransferase family 4 protein [Butyricimonas]
MNILFVIPSMHCGGAERVMSILCNSFSSKGDNVFLCITEDATDIMYPLSDKVQIVNLTCSGSSYVYKIPQYIRGIYDIVKRIKADIVVSFITRTNIYSVLACKAAGVPVIVSERNNPMTIPANRHLRILRNYVYRYADGIVFQTKYARDYYCEKIRRKSTIIKNPCEYSEIVVPYQNKEDIIVSACRLVPQKNVSLLIEAFSLIKDKIPSYKLYIYGDGSLKNDIERQITTNNLQDRVIMKGVDFDLITKMSKCKIFALPSNFEGLSNSLAEALCTGAACIATDSPTFGNREIIIDGENGILTPVGDVNRFADGLFRLTTDMAFANSLSKEAIKIRNSISVSKITSEWQMYMQEIMK